MSFCIVSWIVSPFDGEGDPRNNTKQHEKIAQDPLLSNAEDRGEMRFVKESLINATPERVFAFHEQPDVLQMLTPPWEKVRVIQNAEISEVGSRAIIDTQVFGPVKVRWVAEHTRYEPPHMFEDVQVKGPFRSWRHRHIVTNHAVGAMLRDEIEYEPPLGWLGRAIAPLLIEQRLRRLFNHRHRVTREWCERKG